MVNFWKRLKWDILSNFQTLWCTVLRQLVIYIFLGPFPRFLLLSKARPRIFNNSYQDIVVLLLLFSLLYKTIVFSTKKPAKVSKYWILIWQKVKLSFQLSNTAKFYKLNHTLFEYYSECLISHFPPIFVPLKLTCLVTLFDLQIDYFKSRIWIFCHFLPCYDLSGNTFWPRTSANFLQWLPDGQGVE